MSQAFCFAEVKNQLPILSPRPSKASPTFRRALPNPSFTLPPARSAVPSSSSSRSSIALPTTSLVLPFAWSNLPSTSSLFGKPITLTSWCCERAHRRQQFPASSLLYLSVLRKQPTFLSGGVLDGACESSFDD